MRYRPLGRTGWQVSDVGFGAWGIGGKQWRADNDDQSIAALRRAIELGVNFIDTALAYGDGKSEELVGEVVRTTKSEVLVATKVPPENRIWPARPEFPIGDVFPYDYIVASTEESLRNLGLERIDLQQLHVWTPEWTARDEWKRAAEDLKKAGKIRAFGISVTEHEPDTVLDALRTGLIDAVQVIYNIFDQTPETNLFPLCQELNIGVLARVPLDEGALTGAITEDTDLSGDEFRSWYFRGDRKRQVVEHVVPLQKELEGEPGTLAENALRFVLSHPAVSTVIPGMRRPRTVESSVSVSDRGPLRPDLLARLKRHAWYRSFYC
ncbi:MAG TPA: aldo/keto reductase [Solibacterales bacterium]|nr:aldo/keto reductase [Bryobacterales bacterium]